MDKLSKKEYSEIFKEKLERMKNVYSITRAKPLNIENEIWLEKKKKKKR